MPGFCYTQLLYVMPFSCTAGEMAASGLHSSTALGEALLVMQHSKNPKHNISEKSKFFNLSFWCTKIAHSLEILLFIANSGSRTGHNCWFLLVWKSFSNDTLPINQIVFVAPSRGEKSIQVSKGGLWHHRQLRMDHQRHPSPYKSKENRERKMLRPQSTILKCIWESKQQLLALFWGWNAPVSS